MSDQQIIQALITRDEQVTQQFFFGLKDLTVFWSSPIKINKNIFNGVYLSKSILKVPMGTKELYKVASGWQNFGTIEEM